MMSDTDLKTPASGRKHGWDVVFAAVGINLALGILYTWSVIAGGIPEDWGWADSDKAWPYAVACLVFCLIMVPAGRMQDKLGPRLVASLGGVLVGAGMVAASFTTTALGFVLGFGVLAGAGMGFGYASATPPAVKWFPSAKTGMIAGIVVSGFGLASVYAAPLATWLIKTYGLQIAMRSLGIAFLVVVVGLAQLLKVPHRVEQLVRGLGRAGELKARAETPVKKENFTPGEMMKTWQFYALWFMYACGSGAGLMIIFTAKKLGASVNVGTWFVVFLAIGNGGGRILAGTLSDKLGRKVTLGGFLLFQAVLVLILSVAATKGSALNNALALTVLAALTGANYGSNLALFPAFAKDYYGLKNFGVNYGLIFTSWGVGGFMLAKLAGWVYDGALVASWKGSYDFAFYTSASLLVLAAAVVFFMKAPHHTEPARL
ncbi:MAG: OFA family MFS transporter [Phycisphaerae bacterium]|jgi:MFS family permease|nr:OFA family MFS transporter [Phycisphaerae bacterium]